MNRLKAALVESFVGAIALGWIFATAINHFAGIFVTPIRVWITRKELFAPMRTAASARFSMQAGAPDLLECFVLLLVGYALLRWLYFEPLEATASTDIQTD